jgi:hypothetical protein
MPSIAPMIMNTAAGMIRIERFMTTTSDDLQTYSPEVN